MRKWKYVAITCVIALSGFNIYPQTNLEEEIIKDNECDTSDLETEVETSEQLNNVEVEECIIEDETSGVLKSSDETEMKTQQEKLDVELIDVSAEEHQYLSRDVLNKMLVEHNLEKFIDLNITSDPKVKEMVYIICQMIEEEGVYLPKEERIDDPYLGKLRVLGIWQKDYIELDQEVPINVWDEIYKKAMEYKHTRKPIKYEDAQIEVKIDDYRNKLIKEKKYKDVPLGEIVESKYVLNNGEYTYSLYSLENNNYLDADTLRALGYTIEVSSDGYIISLSNEARQIDNENKKEPRQVKLVDKKIYINDVKSYVISGNDRIFVPLRILESDYNITIIDSQISISNKAKEEKYVKYIDGVLINKSNEQIIIETINYYWNGKELNEVNLEDTLEPNEILEAPDELEKLRGGKYITTEVKAVQTADRIIEYKPMYKQSILGILTNYEESVKYAETNFEELFPSGAIMATVTRNTNGLSKGNQVEVHMQEGGYYTVITSEGKKVRISRGSLYIQKHDKVTAKAATKSQIEEYINKRNISSNTEYLVWTDIYRQTTYVLKGNKNNWKLIRRMPCSTGENTTPTPRGFYTLNAKVPSFGQAKGYCCKNAFGFIGTVYLYHSILFDTSGSYIISGKKELGVEKASHGCIRLTPDDSYWMYNTVSKGTKAWIN